MARAKKNYHVGGEQLLLITPNSDWRAPKFLQDLRNCRMIAVDLECKDDGLAAKRGPGWATGAGYVCGVSMAWRREDGELRSAYYPVRHPDTQCFGDEQMRRWFLDHWGCRFVFQNAPYDLGWIWRQWGIKPFETIDDSACMAYMVDENRLNYGLSSLCSWRGLPQKNEKLLREASIAYGFDPKSEMWRLPARYVGEYAEQDAVSTLLLHESLEPEIRKQELEKAYRLEMDLVPMVHEMRRRGVRLDMKRCAQLYDKFKLESKQALEDLSDKLRHAVGIDELRSNSWLDKVFSSEKIPFPRALISGKGSFEAKWMKKMDHWLPRLVVRAKSREEMAEKFIKNYLMSYVTPAGRLHPSINQYRGENLYDEEGRGSGTRTFRFSYSDPPLQQIPHRDEDAAVIRDAFIPEEGEEWASADYSQQEYRLIVHYAALRKLPKAEEALRRYLDDPDTDFHSMVAEMTGLERKPAKDANFAKAYGAGAQKFASMINKTEEEAAAIMQQYDQKMPFVKLLYDECSRYANSRGYIKLLDGARIHFDWWFPVYFRKNNYTTKWSKQDGTSDCRGDEARMRVADPQHPWHGYRLRRSRGHKAMNSLIQGGAARQTKIAMRACWRAGHVPLLQVHDELCFSVAGGRAEADRIAEIMRDVVPLLLPMRVDVDLGRSWWAGKA